MARDTLVIIFGAGATKDCGGPLTNEILHEAFQADPSLVPQQNATQLLRQFLDGNFPLGRTGSQGCWKANYLATPEGHLPGRTLLGTAS